MEHVYSILCGTLSRPDFKLYLLKLDDWCIESESFAVPLNDITLVEVRIINTLRLGLLSKHRSECSNLLSMTHLSPPGELASLPTTPSPESECIVDCISEPNDTRDQDEPIVSRKVCIIITRRIRLLNLFRSSGPIIVRSYLAGSQLHCTNTLA